MRGTLLVIDDDHATVQFIQDFLGLEGYTVLHTAASMAIETALTTAVDAILISSRLPGTDVPTLIRQIRATAAIAAIPIISMTEHSPYTRPTDPLITDYLSKPLRLDALTVTVARWMKKSPHPPAQEPQKSANKPHKGGKRRDDKH